MTEDFSIVPSRLQAEMLSYFKLLKLLIVNKI